MTNCADILITSINVLLLVIFTIWLFYLMVMIKNYVDVKGLEKTKRTNATPLVSVIIPTRNESDRIEECIKSLKEQTYRNLEIIIVDDSSDDTIDVIEKLVGNDKRFKLVQQGEVPRGWIGKSYALQKGSKLASGEWLLMLDADVRLSSETIEKAVSYAEEKDIDLLSLVPNLLCKTFWEKVIQPIFGGLILFVCPPFLVNNPKSRVAFAMGPFILIRRKVFEKVGGYEKIKDKITDDVELARLIKRSGYKINILNGQNALDLRMYRNFKEIWSGWSKNVFLGFTYLYDIKSKPVFLLIAIGGTIGIFAFISLPFIMLLTSGIGVMLGLGIFLSTLFLSFITWLFSTITQIFLRIVYKGYPLYTFLSFLGGIVASAIFINSSLRVMLGKGVEWKGRIYYRRKQSR